MTSCMNGICTATSQYQTNDLMGFVNMISGTEPSIPFRAGLVRTLTNDFSAKVVSSSIVVPATEGTHISPKRLLEIYPEGDYLLDIATQEWNVESGNFHLDMTMRLISRTTSATIASADCGTRSTMPITKISKADQPKVVAYLVQYPGQECARTYSADWLNTAKNVPLPEDLRKKLTGK